MLSAKAKPYIEASVPVLREHGLAITTYFYKSMFEAHPELKNLFNMGNQANGSQQQSLAAAVFAYAANIDNAAALAPVIERIVHKHVSVGIKPEHYPIVGKHLLMAIQHVLGDAATTALLSAWAEAYSLLADTLIDAEKRLYHAHHQQPDEWLKLRIIDKQHLTDHIISLTLQAFDQQALPVFKPGQYISVAINIEELGFRQIRQYSLSDSPSKNTYRITIKREIGDEYKPKGQVSNWLHQHTRVGSILNVSHPCGNFTPDIQDEFPISLISAGVGITPMISVLNTIASENPNRPVLFLHVARDRANVAHIAEIEHAKRQIKQLQSILYFSEAHSQNAEEREGNMDLSLHLTPEFKTGSFYICGPQAFMDEQRETLLELGVSPEKIYREVFGPESLNHLIH